MGRVYTVFGATWTRHAKWQALAKYLRRIIPLMEAPLPVVWPKGVAWPVFGFSGLALVGG